MGASSRPRTIDAAVVAWQRACDAHDPFALRCAPSRSRGSGDGGDGGASLDLDGTGAGHAAVTTESPPTNVEISSGGEVDIAQLGLRPSCTGVVTREADLVVDVTASVPRSISPWRAHRHDAGGS